MPVELLVVSPHLDDAILSCWALLEGPDPVDVLTVFAGAPDPPQQGWWDEETGFESSAESVPARLAEDEEAFLGMSHRRSYLGLLELQHMSGPRPEAGAEPIRAAVEEWLVGRARPTVALPAGAGCPRGRLRAKLRRFRPCNPMPHADHLFVRDVVVSLLRGTDTTVYLYEEIPYLFGRPADREVRRVARAIGRTPELLAKPVDREAKARRIAAYASQIPHISPDQGRLDHPAVLPATERYWLLPP